MKMTRTEVGIRIKSIRQSLGLTLEEFGLLIKNAHKSNVSKWEHGVSIPNNERLKIIAELSNMSVNQLIYGKVGKVTTNNIAINCQGKKYTIVIKEGNQDRWLTVDEDTARELISKLGSVLND